MTWFTLLTRQTLQNVLTPEWHTLMRIHKPARLDLTNDGELSLFFVGCGSAFAKTLNQTNLLIVKGGILTGIGRLVIRPVFPAKRMHLPHTRLKEPDHRLEIIQ